MCEQAGPLCSGRNYPWLKGGTFNPQQAAEGTKVDLVLDFIVYREFLLFWFSPAAHVRVKQNTLLMRWLKEENVFLPFHYVSACSSALQPFPGASYVCFTMIPAAPIINKTMMGNYFICFLLFSCIDSWACRLQLEAFLAACNMVIRKDIGLKRTLLMLASFPQSSILLALSVDILNSRAMHFKLNNRWGAQQDVPVPHFLSAQGHSDSILSSVSSINLGRN